MKKGIFLILCLFPMLCFAQKDEKTCGFSIECKIPKQTFSIIISSPSNDCANDDQEIYLKANGK